MSSSTQNILTTRSVGVHNVRSLNDLECSSHNNIIFDTPNILIRDLRIDKYIKNLIFNESNIDVPTVYRINRQLGVDQINITNAGETVLTGLDALEISSLNSFVDDNVIEQEHYVNLSVSDSNVLRINSSNIYKESQFFYNYVYDLVNEAIVVNSNTGGTTFDDTTQSNVHDQDPTNRFNVSNMGEYLTNTVFTNEITTKNIFVDSSGNIFEPSLCFKSRSAVNLNSLHIEINGIDVDTYIKQSLNETGLISVNITPRSGLSISYTYNDVDWFINTIYGNRFTYDITFRIYDHGESLENLNNPVYIRDIVINSNINQGVDPNNTEHASGLLSYSNVFDENLIAGSSYDIYASVRNQLTNTIVPNILVAENVFTIPPLEIVRIIVIDETKVQIVYKQHQIQIDGFTPVVSFALSVVKISELVPAVDDDNAFVNPTSPRSFPNQNLHQIFSTAEQSYLYYVSDFTDSSLYHSTFLVDGIDHYFHIKNNLGMVSSYNLLWTHWETFFTAPSAPYNVNIVYSSTDTYTFSWNPPTNTGNALNMYYKIYLNGVLYDDIQGIFGTTTTSIIASPITSGNWTIVAYNVYGHETQSLSFTVTSPTITTTSIYSVSNRQFNITYNVSNFNRKYNLSGTNLVSKTSQQSSNGSITTIALNPGTYNFTVNLTDDLNKTAFDNSQSITIKSPILTITNAAYPEMYYTGTPRQFRIYLYYYNFNGSGVNLNGIPSLTDAVYNNVVSGTLSWIYFTFNDRISGGNKTCNASIIDQWGYVANHTKTDLNLIINFVNISNTINIGTNRTLIHNTSGLTNYQWYRDGTYLGSSGGTNSFQISNTSGTYYCIITQTQQYGFTRTIQSNSVTKTLPTITDKSFSVTSQPSTYTYAFVYNGTSYTYPSLPGGASLSLSPSSIFTSAGTYTLSVTITDANGLTSTLVVGEFIVIVPTIGTLSEFDKSPYSIEVKWSTFGTNGTPNQTPSSIRLYYKLKSESVYTNSGIDISGLQSTNGSYLIEGLIQGTEYTFKMEKTFPNYATVSDTITLRTLASPASPPVLDDDLTYNGVTNTSITLYWSEGSNGSATSVTYTIEYKPIGSSTWMVAFDNISYDSPQTIASLSSDYAYDVKVTKIARLDDGSILNTTEALMSYVLGLEYKPSEVYFIGYNYYGHCSTLVDQNTQSFTPTKINKDPADQSVYFYESQVKCGYFFTVFQERGRLFTCGYNNKGSLGTNKVSNGWNFPITAVSNIDFYETNYINDYLITHVVPGHDHTVAYTIYGNDSHIFTWGNNYWGQCGYPDTHFLHSRNESYYPVKLPTITGEKIISIACLVDGTLVLTDGGLWSCGNNTHGALGFHREVDEGLRGDRTLTKAPSTPFDFTTVTRMKAGLETTYFLTHENKLYASGDNSKGQLANGQVSANNISTQPELCSSFESYAIKDFFPTYSGIYILTTTDELYGVGYRIGHPTNTSSTITLTPTRCLPDKTIKEVATALADTVYVIDQNDDLWLTGPLYDGLLGTRFQPSYYATFTLIDSGVRHCINIGSSGALYHK